MLSGLGFLEHPRCVYIGRLVSRTHQCQLPPANSSRLVVLVADCLMFQTTSARVQCTETAHTAAHKGARQSP
jgi:hypothetical protein